MIDIDWYGEIGEESEPEDCVDRDPDWVQTPLVPSRRSGRRTHSGESKLLSAVPNFQQVNMMNMMVNMMNNLPYSLLAAK